MPWLQIILDTDAQSVDPISDSLTELGAVAVTLVDAENQPLYEPPLNTTPLWKQTRIIGLFENDIDSHQLQKQLKALIAPLPLPPCQIQRLKDQEWTRVWMDDFHPLQFGKRVWICPSWQKPPDSEAITILLDPGLAFGTGTHPTTALCLEWLDQQNDLSDQVLIDYGCGSGILGITALKLGAAHVWAVDNDPQALLATLDNAKKNEVEAGITAVLPEELPEDIKVDGILANILATPLIKLAPTLIRHLNSNAPLVLSGLLQEQVEQVIAAYAPYATVVEQVEQENWMRLVAQYNMKSV
jgi:ribosomal protein L11 methyltransferase